MKIYNNILELTGNTPLVRLSKIEEKYRLNVKLIAKLEMFNPSGSVKIRPAKNMLEKALEEKVINKDTIIIEPTSGNMGIALAMACCVMGLKFIAVMPSNMSLERQKLIKSYGAEIVLTEAKFGMQGAVDKAKKLQKELNGFIPFQFENKYNPLSHITTAQEIYSDTLGSVDMVFCGIGTGGTISGIGRYLKSIKDVKMIGVEPSESPLITNNVIGPHRIQGIGANFIPDNLDLNVVDVVVTVSSDESFIVLRELAMLEGIFAGISSGAALKGAIDYIKNNNVKDKTIVVILPDTGERYLSMDLGYE
jgi:cysteine synthase A